MIIILAASLSVSSCTRSEKLPAGILAKEEMIKILKEVYISEEKVNRLGLNRDTSEKVFNYMEGKVYEKYGVPDSVFDASFDYYMDRPKEMEQIYTALVDSLQLMEQRAPSTQN
ncbi:DUF4296 domain-containing protein [Chryseosolibacter indicus]|uniref:DUF4296 domain-containing protein n=1 Tax=Chryseosolibacter indicus TaxID=2782351 RepID=UPI0020B3F501|nr:DUF4296 domain-containing protein [Chryseosolibacter indicus]